MTKKLEALFNLPSRDTDSVSDQSQKYADEQVIEEQQKLLDDVNLTIDKIDGALPFVAGLEKSDEELDELANLAKNSAQDLLDLGMQVDSRFSGQIFQTAGVLLGHAITAKQAKMDKKLRMIDLQLKKMRLDHQIKQDSGVDSGAIEGQGTVIDRNTLLAQILNKTKQ